MSLEKKKPEKVISEIAESLKKIPELSPPSWNGFVKSGVHKERAPEQPDFWWIRAASILRKIYLNQPLGVSKFRKIYGGRKRRGHKRAHKFKASGAIIRKILQQLEKAEFVKSEKGKGRVLTEKGRDFLNSFNKEMK